MDILTFARVPYEVKLETKTLKLSVLDLSDWIVISSALKQGFHDLIDNDKSLKAVEKAKAKATYVVGIGEAINFAIYDPSGQAFAIYLSAKKLQPDITQEEIQKLIIEPNSKIEILEYLSAFPEARKLPESVVLTDEIKEKLAKEEEENKKKL